MSRIAELRQAKGWTQRELAYRVGAGERSVQAWEGGDRLPPTRRRRRLAKVLGVAVEELGLGEEPAGRST